MRGGEKKSDDELFSGKNPRETSQAKGSVMGKNISLLPLLPLPLGKHLHRTTVPFNEGITLFDSLLENHHY